MTQERIGVGEGQIRARAVPRLVAQETHRGTDTAACPSPSSHPFFIDLNRKGEPGPKKSQS